MPAGNGAGETGGGSYRSLAPDGGVVYRTTTANNEAGFSVVETVKKAFNMVSSHSNQSSLAPHGYNNYHHQPLINKRQNVNIVPRKMPTSATAEETALLGRMPSESMDDIELKNIQMEGGAGAGSTVVGIGAACPRRFSREDPSIEELRVQTDRGPLLVAVQGNRNKPALLTYHDIGLNYIASFQAFFNYSEMRQLLENFCVYHVNAPGQEEGAAPLPDDYEYPTMDELAAQLNFVLTHFGLKSVIGLGVGAGGNVLCRYALGQPHRMEALVLVNVVSTQAGWIEWGYQKLNARSLKSKGMTQPVLDYLMWHHFGRGTEERNQDLVQVYRSYFERCIQPGNLAKFIDSYIRRTDLNMTRSLDPDRKESLTLAMPVINITGSMSPHVDDTVTLNSRLDPTNSSWMKISDCGMVLEEQPGKVSEALRLFLQGLGYAIRVGRKRISSSASVEGKCT